MIRYLLSFIQPVSLSLSVLTFVMGTGLVQYFGYKIDWSAFFLGLVGIFLLQLNSNFLKCFFDVADQTPPIVDLNKARNQKFFLIVSSAILLTIGVIVTLSLLASGALKISTFVVLGMALFISFFHGVPPLRLIYSGYGELAEAFVLAILTPALAFLLQTDHYNQFLLMISIPVAAQIFARTLANSIITFLSDLKNERRTLIVRIGWQRGMNLHHIMVLVSYFLLLWATYWELPWSLAWRGLLTLPLGMFQIFQIARIAGGANPNWRLLKITSTSTVILMVVLISSGLWG
jgi:1,4-dihydroxy-2-naphthoate octaprenyltransferase